MNVELILFSDTDPAVELAIRRCAGLLTKNHSITSRRYSISTLLRKELDDPFNQAVTKYRGRWNKALLDGFLPSKAWLTPPGGIKSGETTSLDNVEVANECAGRWRARLRSAIRSAQASTGKPFAANCERFCSTLDTVMALITKFSSLLPAHTHSAKGRVALKAKGCNISYCELCWRQTEYAAQGELRDAEDQRQKISRRFCVEHNQQKSPSGYRRDLKFKELFAQELELLSRHNLTRKKSPFVFLPDATCVSGRQIHLVPVSVYEEDMRRAAYAVVHSGLQGTQGQCLALKAKGYSIAEIAERLSITDRAVRLALAAAKSRLKSAERIRWGGRSAPL